MYSGEVMRVALEVLCIGAVMFMLRFLVALLKEVTNLSHPAQSNLGRFNPPMRRGELIVMRPVVPRLEFPGEPDERVAF